MEEPQKLHTTIRPVLHFGTQPSSGCFLVSACYRPYARIYLVAVLRDGNFFLPPSYLLFVVRFKLLLTLLILVPRYTFCSPKEPSFFKRPYWNLYFISGADQRKPETMLSQSLDALLFPRSPQHSTKRMTNPSVLPGYQIEGCRRSEQTAFSGIPVQMAFWLSPQFLLVASGTV